jgi:hypothetical protein
MAYLISILVSIALLAAFLALAAREGKTGRRAFAGFRRSLDREAGRVEFVFAHVDFASALRALLVAAGERLAHDLAHGILLAVRLAERLLTRAVRALRTRRAQVRVERAAAPEDAPALPSVPATPLAKTLRDFKDHLRRHPKAPRPAAADETGAVE